MNWLARYIKRINTKKPDESQYLRLFEKLFGLEKGMLDEPGTALNMLHINDKPKEDYIDYEEYFFRKNKDRPKCTSLLFALTRPYIDTAQQVVSELESKGYEVIKIDEGISEYEPLKGFPFYIARIERRKQ